MGYSSSGGGHSGYTGTKAVSTTHHHKFGIGGLVANLGSDVKDAVVGLPTGIVETIKHPIKSGKVMARATWQDWKPLFEGHPVAFAKQTYDHPLAPLLDVATVFSAGAGISAKLGEAAVTAGSTSRLAASAAALGKTSSRLVYDPAKVGEVVAASSGRGARVVDAAHAERTASSLRNLDTQISTLKRKLAAPLTKTEELEAAGKAIHEGRMAVAGVRAPAVRDSSGVVIQGKSVAREGHAPRSTPSWRENAKSQLALLEKEREKVARTPERFVREGTAAAPGEIDRGTPLVKSYGDSAAKNLRRHLANRALLHLEPHLPAWFKQSAREGRLYSKLQTVEDAHKVAAKNLQVRGLMEASKVMNDPAAQKFIQPALLTHNYANFRWHAAKVGLNHVLAPGERYVVNPHVAEARLKYDPMNPDFVVRMRRFGDDFTTDDPAKADVNGQRLVIRTDAIKAHAAEGEASTKFIRGLLPNATKWWKRIQVGYAPRVITNNAVGNWFMHAMRTGGNGGGHAMIDAIRHARGEHAAARSFRDMHAHIVAQHGPEQGARFLAATHPVLHGEPDLAKIERVFGKRAAEAVKRPPNWARQYFSDELGNVFGNVLKDGQDVAESRLGKVAQQGMYPLVERVADRPVRVAALYQYMRRAPEVKAYLRANPGATLDSAIHKVLDKNEGHLRERAVQHVRSIAGDYTTMGPHERLIQNIVPFYLWDKHIAKHFGNMVGEKPGRVALMQNLSRMGNDEQKKLLGELPGFMAGVLPLSLLGMHDHNGRSPILGTQGLNPYSTIGELADAATALTTRHDAKSGSEAAAQLSPILTGLIEQISGHKIGSNAPAESHGGIVPSVLADTALGTSYGTLAQRLVNGTPQPKVDSHGKSKDFLYQKNAREVVAGLLGLPVKNVSLDRAAEMAAQDLSEDEKKKKRKSFQLGR